MEEKNRAILHLDLDSFYPSVEQRDRPELRGKPVVVGGDPFGRGVVASASYEARRYGVHSAQSCQRARQLCPDAVFLRPRFAVYKAISQQIFKIYASYTTLVEPVALDEAYLNVSALVSEQLSAVQIAREMKTRIYEETQLTASAGVSHNKLLAKLGSDHQKPDGLTEITLETALAFLEPLPVGKLLGVGEVTEAKLKSLNITTCGDLRALDIRRLQDLFGKRGKELYSFARGEDARPVTPDRERKSVGKESTFAQDITDRAEMLGILGQLAEQVEQRLRELGIASRTITLKLRWHNFVLLTRSTSVPFPIQDASEMMRHITPLLDQLLGEKKAVRLLGITLSHLVPQSKMRDQVAMPSLWDAVSE